MEQSPLYAKLEHMIVAKFGGSVIGVDGASIPDIIKRIMVLAESSKVVAVFSAPPTIHNQSSTSLTDIVIMCGEAAERGEKYDVSAVRNVYATILGKQNDGVKRKCEPIVNLHLSEFDAALADAAKLGSFSDEIRSRALGHSGELLMSEIMAIIINDGKLNASAISLDEWPIITDNNIESTNFLRETSLKACVPLTKLVKENDVVTIGGFVGKATDGTITTYERGGSDRTAADIGILFHGSYDVVIDLEKDSNVASADPRIVESVDEIPELSYNEARIAGMFGMKILDPIAIKEMHEYGMNIPVTITNMHNPSKITSITRTSSKLEKDNPLKIVTGKKDCAIVRIESSTAIELLSSLKNERRYEEYVILSPFMQGGIEYARILFLDAKYVKRNDRYIKKFDPFCTVTYNRGVITLIGDEMSRAQHVVSNISACIGDTGLTILNMDAQEETSRIIVVVEDSDDKIERAIRAIHEKRDSIV